MTQGVLLYAHNNEEIDYGLMALWSARRIAAWLDRPVSLVTDQTTCDALDQQYRPWRSSFDRVILQEIHTDQTKKYIDRALTFRNLSRADAYDLTPYDETVVVDTDIVIQSRNLNKLWGLDQDIVVMDRSTDLFGRYDPEFTWVSNFSIKFYWATQFYFKKGPLSQYFFKECQRVRAQYDAYRYLYHLPGGPVRNDFVWSIVLHTLGHSIATIPWNTMYSPGSNRVINMNSTAIQILGNSCLARVEGQDLHVMNKFDLIKHIRKELLI
jgi:hypothetical protein